MTIRNQLALLISLLCISLFLRDHLFSLVFNDRKESFYMYSLPVNRKNDHAVDETINLGFSAFEREQAKLGEKKLHNDYDLTAILVHWKRFDRLERTLQYLLHIDLFKEIIIWNNKPQIQLTNDQFTQHNQSHQFIRIVNTKENLKNQAKYHACVQAKTHACFYINDHYNVAHYLKSLIASFRSDPNLLHVVTDAYTFHTNLVQTDSNLKINLHVDFSYMEYGSIFLRKHAQQHLQLMHRVFHNHTGN